MCVRSSTIDQNGIVELRYGVRWTSQNAGPEDVSIDVRIFINNQLATVVTEQAINGGSGGQTCGGSCNPGDCSHLGPESTCHDFSGIPGSHGCQCSIVVYNTVNIAPSPGDIVSVEVAAAQGAVPELYNNNDRASIQYEELYPSSCNGDGGNQMGCSDCPCMNNAPSPTVGGCLNSAGTSASLHATGSNSVSLPFGSTDDLRFGLDGAPPNAFCVLVSGDAVAPQNAASPCFGLDSGSQSISFDGLRCSVQGTVRHGGRSADLNGDVGVTNNPWGGAGGPPAGIVPAAGFAAGQSRYFQSINRDNSMLSCMRGLNTSQAVRASFCP